MPVFNVLFVSYHNAMRSQIAEVCLRQLGQQRFSIYSCGIPGEIAKEPSTCAIMALNTAGMSAEDCRCKPWSEFTRSGAPRMDFVIGLDEDSYHLHPAWPGQPETALWVTPAVNARRLGTHKAGVAAIETLHALRRRIELLVNLASRASDASALRHDLRDITHM